MFERANLRNYWFEFDNHYIYFESQWGGRFFLTLQLGIEWLTHEFRFGS